MPRVIVIDHTIIEEVNHGNVHVANALKSLRAKGAEMWISYEITQTNLRTDADKRLLNDLGVRDDYMSVLNRRGSHNAKWDNTVNQLGVDHKNSPSANLALEKKAELMTMNKALADAWNKSGGTTTPEIKFLKPVHNRTPNYARSRQLVGLKPLTVNAKGQVNPQTKRYAPAPAPAIVIKGKSGQWVPKTGGYEKARTGTPQKVKPDVIPDPDGAGRVAKHKIYLGGVDKVMHWINDSIQSKRFNERWAKIEPGIRNKQDKDPALGVLVYVYFSRSTAHADSALTPVNVFQDISVGYGYTYNDARMDLFQKTSMVVRGAGDQVAGEEIWFEPLTGLDIKNIEAPYQKAGLATFVPGREMLVNVKFSGSAGFDDRMKSVTKLKIQKGDPIAFFYLWPPKDVRYANGKIHRSVGIDQALEHPAEVIDEELKLAFVPVVELDSSFNPWDATAAMVFPANNTTLALFKEAPATKDLNGLINGVNLEFIRWVKPKNMRVIRDFASEITTTSREEISTSRY